MKWLSRLRKRNKVAYASFWMLIILYLSAILAPVLSPYAFDLQKRKKSFCPPTKIHFREANGTFHIRPFIYNYKKITFGKYVEDTSKPYFIHLFYRGKLFGVEEPAGIFLLGTDSFGRDIFSRLLSGGRISLSVGLVGVFISFLLGLLLGGISGYYGGKLDFILMRITELVMAFPGFYLILALRAVFPVSLSSAQVYLLIVGILSFIGWASLGRVIRGMVLSLREEDYVLAGQALGLSNFRIIWRHILPNTLSYTITAATLSIPGYILGESALSLLGLGIQEPIPSWGNMLATAVGNISMVVNYPWVLSSGFLIFIAVLAYNFLGDGLRDIFDPKNW